MELKFVAESNRLSFTHRIAHPYPEPGFLSANSFDNILVIVSLLFNNYSEKS